ncbi:hypothetical protein DAEQUDRAFT_729658 [Daedalea quercina L-15889]|uniref:SH3 domain-containing protein n=1 Tax=Daedalea quercina L-15889 TaxID=1314783 RepID=A0A165NJV6_9APHY|nr:hypothetical protein DAEQUDRAFT_729658 [Daedalea quercina L-15889]
MQRPAQQDTFDLRDQILADDHNSQMMDHAYPSDEEHSVLEDDSDTDDRDEFMVDDDDGSSSLSIPNESIDFDLVYALHSFAATVEGQANVVKGDSLFLMDDSNSYWWLVRVLKTQEVGYIPAENIETPFERLARLNKHRNVDLASATHAELEETRDRLRENVSRGAPSPSPTPTPAGARSSRHARGVSFTAAFSVHRYPPAVWNEEDEEDEDVEWDDEGYEDEDPELAEEQEERERTMMTEGSGGEGGIPGMEPDDDMSWEDGAVEQVQAKEREAAAAAAAAATAAAAAEAERVRQQLQQQEQELREQQQRELQAQSLRKQPSREHMQAQPSGVEVLPNSPTKTMDPAHVTETRKLTMTPPVARVDDARSLTTDDRKRAREEEEEVARKKASSLAADRAKAGLGPTPGARPASAGGKLRKERDSTDDESGKDKDKKKKSGGMFGGIFGRKKDKDKGKDKGVDSSSVASGGSDRDPSRESEESGKSLKDSAPAPEPASPVTAMARQQQQQQQSGYRASPVRQQAQLQPQQQTPQTPPQAAIASISQHASQLRQRDQQQQALYQQYLNRSPSTPPEAQPSYGLQSASAVLQGSASFTSSISSGSGLTTGGGRPRPGSLVLSPSGMDGLLPDLSVVRVFAGSNLQTEATFKTVLLNTSTTAQDLVRQAIQRFRLPAGEDEKDYYLTIKQVEGSSADLLPHEKPLGVFESLVEAALELPKVKRSSVGSISSVASNLSMHPAIKKLSMNDFTDDSAVKFYLNRRGGEELSIGGEGDETLLAESVQGEDPESPRSKSQYLTVTPTSPTNGVTLERFSSPSYRFPLQLVIYPDDLPDDMVFDPQTEAIIFKNTLRDRPQVGPSPGLQQNLRKKVFVFPRNVTVAEVIELGLERFGILEGVVDGGDEIEDKLTKRRSSSRVRYGLTVDVGGKERELTPSSKVIDAFPRPPTYRAMQFGNSKRRSADSAQLLGSLDDVSPDDPVFILRRAVAYRATSRHRLSAPLDEIALQRMQRNSASSSSAGSDSTVGPAEDTRSQTSQTSKQAIIAAQRAATRASQRAILSAQANESRGLDVALPSGAIVRSLRGEVDNRMRYSYVEPDGETYDISNIVEEEWRGEVGPLTRSDTTADDLLHGVLARGKDGLGAKLDRVLSKIKHEKDAARGGSAQSNSDVFTDVGAVRTQSPSTYSTADEGASRAATAIPTASGRASAAVQRVPSSLSRISSYRTASPGESSDSHGKRSVTPNANQRRGLLHERQGSALSEASAHRTTTPTSHHVASAGRYQTPLPTPRLVLPRDDFGLAQMMAVIELRASQQKDVPESTPQDRVDELLFGKPNDMNALHPQIRDIYSGSFKQLEEMDQTLDQLLHLVIPSRQ